jgi:hypothetical protein
MISVFARWRAQIIETVLCVVFALWLIRFVISFVSALVYFAGHGPRPWQGAGGDRRGLGRVPYERVEGFERMSVPLVVVEFAGRIQRGENCALTRSRAAHRWQLIPG